MNQIEVLVLFTGIIVVLTGLKLLFNAQKVSFKPTTDDLPVEDDEYEWQYFVLQAVVFFEFTAA